MSQNKTELRQQLRQTRLAMTQEQHRLASEAIAKRLNTLLDWSTIKSLHYFEPIGAMLEPDISPFITHLEDTYPKLELFTTRMIGGKWQLMAVRGGTAPDQFDVVLVPMLGFDPQTLHRLGYGGGFYDKLLAMQPQARKIGVSFEQGKADGLSAEPHDILLDVIITESSVYSLPGRL